jgi:nitroimidazol reductase NimA-like FMN-containing flavoprotein (pyridoxamine 5'-phosphate oxidase superfamily)
MTTKHSSARHPEADTRHRRVAERGSHDFELACRVLDDALICHVGFTLEQQPYVVPMACARDGDQLLIHGSVASRLMKTLADGLLCCVTVTHLDALVLARSAFHSSMNYRSVMVFGKARLVTDMDERQHGFDVLVDHLLPGRLAELRDSTRKELNATTLLKLPIETFSIKQRSGPPSDPEADMTQAVWAGVVPLDTVRGTPVPAPELAEGTALPAYLRKI